MRKYFITVLVLLLITVVFSLAIYAGTVSWEKIFKGVKIAAERTSVDPALLLGVLRTESHYGRNVGENIDINNPIARCKQFKENEATGKKKLANQGTPKEKEEWKNFKDWDENKIEEWAKGRCDNFYAQFQRICNIASFDCKTIETSPTFAVGYMQFQPDQWLNVQVSHSDELKNPWSYEDALSAAGYKLKPVIDSEGEEKALSSYHGDNSKVNDEETYSQFVQRKKAEWQEFFNKANKAYCNNNGDIVCTLDKLQDFFNEKDNVCAVPDFSCLDIRVSADSEKIKQIPIDEAQKQIDALKKQIEDLQKQVEEKQKEEEQKKIAEQAVADEAKKKEQEEEKQKAIETLSKETEKTQTPAPKPADNKPVEPVPPIVYKNPFQDFYDFYPKDGEAQKCMKSKLGSKFTAFYNGDSIPTKEELNRTEDCFDSIKRFFDLAPMSLQQCIKNAFDSNSDFEKAINDSNYREPPEIENKIAECPAFQEMVKKAEALDQYIKSNNKVDAPTNLPTTPPEEIQKPEISVTPISIDVPATAGSDTFYITTNESVFRFGAEVTESSSWLSSEIASTKSTEKNEWPVTITYTANNSSSPRIGKITTTAEGTTGNAAIGSPTIITITQAAAQDLTDTKLYNVTGILVDKNNNPLPNVKFNMGKKLKRGIYSETDRDGQIKVASLSPGKYCLMISLSESAYAAFLDFEIINSNVNLGEVVYDITFLQGRGGCHY